MPENVRMWVEVAFNISYLIGIWGLVALMAARIGLVAESDRAVAKRVMWAFALLGLGDTGHVGFRVIAYAMGGLEASPALVGLGSLSTAYTVTLFYMLLVDIWRLRFHKPFGIFGWTLLGAGVARMIVMLFPQNGWSQLSGPYEWSLLRNAFLVVQGLGVMYLILRDSAAANDATFRQIGWMIALSYTFYAPVILWSGQIPMLGMLMIPKTLAYVAIAVIAYRAIFAGKQGFAVGKQVLTRMSD